MSGAAVMCGSAALRGGAGLVCVATPQDVQQCVASGNPCYTTMVLHQNVSGQYDDRAIEELKTKFETVDTVAIGPGLGNRADVSRLVISLVEQTDKAMVLDADGLNVWAPDSLPHRKQPLILTPHPGEFARLLGISIGEVQSNRAELAKRFAAKYKCLVILKGAGTIVSDGQRIYTNTTGNPGMATGGTGDVLAGFLAALLAQGFSAWDAAVLSVYLHGLAGDLAAAELGQVSLIATDLLTYLPRAIQQHVGR
jgi:NAD(P)H-hydrate epimerase